MRIFIYRVILYIVVGLITVPSTVNGQTPRQKPTVEIVKLIGEIDHLIHKHSLFKDSLNWEQIYTDIKALSFSGADTTNRRQVFEVFTRHLRKAGDKHSFFLTTAAAKAFEKKERSAAKPKARYLGAGIGLITVPYCFNNQPAKDIAFANTIRQQIKRVDSKNDVVAWIVDLRNNTGGNMWPMLAGLNALIEDGTAGFFINPATGTEQPWPSNNGKLMLPKAEVDNYKIRNRDIKIAVLIDSMTASSGEMTAVSFIGLPNVKILGQPSAGYTTANNTLYLSDGTMFNLAALYIADRTKKPFMYKLHPDILLKQSGEKGIQEAVMITKLWMQNAKEK
jgi:carboxyl-terminal processing protease